MRPGPRRPCAISKPLPSPSRMLLTGTRTFSRSTWAWPCGASSKPNTGSIFSTVMPLVARRAGIGLAHHDQHLTAGIADARRPPLAAVDHIVVAVALDAGLDIGGI